MKRQELEELRDYVDGAMDDILQGWSMSNAHDISGGPFMSALSCLHTTRRMLKDAIEATEADDDTTEDGKEAQQ